MKTMKAIALLLLTASIAFAGDAVLQFSKAEIIQVEPANSIGQVKVSWKAAVRNAGTSPVKDKVLWFACYDEKGFELDRCGVTGVSLNPGETKAVTVSGYLTSTVYSHVRSSSIIER